MAEEKVSILAVLQDRFSPTMTRIVKGSVRLGRALRDAGRMGTRSLGLVGSALRTVRSQIFNIRNLLAGAAIGGIVKVFSDFEAGLTDVFTLIDDWEDHAETFTQGLKNIARDSGQSFDSLNKALFDTVSAGVEAGEALKFLEGAARLAVGGGTDIAAATKGLVATLNAYGMSAENAEEVSDSLFKAMKGGITTIAELASNVGKVAPVASLVGVTIDEMNAALAAITKTGISTDEAVTALRATFVTLLKPQQDALDIAQELAEKYPELNFEMSTASLRAKGLARWFRDLAVVTGGNDVIMGRLFSNVRAFTGVAALAKDEARELGEMIASMGDKAGATVTAFGLKTDTLSFKLAQFKTTVLVLLTELGEALKPFIENVLERMRKWVDDISSQQNVLRTWVRGIVRLFQNVGGAVAALVKNLDVAPFLVNSVIAGIAGMVRVFIASIPLLLKTVTLLGRQIGVAIITAIIGASREELARKLGGGDASFATRILAQLGLGADTVAELTEVGHKIAQWEEPIRRIRELMDQGRDATISALEAGEDLGFGRAGTLRRNFTARVLEMAREDWEGFVAYVEQSEAELSRLRDSLSGQVTEGMFAEDKERLRELTREFVDDAGRIIGEELQGLPEGLSPATQVAFKKLFETFGKEFDAELKVAAARDIAAQLITTVEDAIDQAAAGLEPLPDILARILGFAGEETVTTGQAQLGLAGEQVQLDINAVVDEIGKAFEKLEQHMAVFRAHRDEARALGEGGYVFQSEALELERQALADMNTEINTFNTLLTTFLTKAAESGQADFLIEKLTVIAEKFRLIREEAKGADEEQGDFWTGLQAGIEGATDDFETFRQVGVAAGQAVANAFADAVVDALFEGRKSLREYVADFLKLVAKMIVRALILKAINATISSFDGGSVASDGGQTEARTARRGGVLKLAPGGPVPGPSYVQHDIVPALLTPGEFVIPKRVVKYYGAGAMEALRRKIIPRETLATVARPTPRRIRRGFQTGGEVGSGTLATQGPIRAVVVSDEGELDRMLAGGRRAMLDFIGVNRDEIRRVLGGS